MQNTCEITRWPWLARTPNAPRSRVVTGKTLRHSYRTTKARGNILNSSPPAVRRDKWLRAFPSCDIVRLNKYSVTQGTLWHSEKHKDRKSTPQDKHRSETKGGKSLTRPGEKCLNKMILKTTWRQKNEFGLLSWPNKTTGSCPVSKHEQGKGFFLMYVKQT